jgi:toxin ParE1/3/4
LLEALPYRLTRAAEEDVIGVYIEGARQFGAIQAEKYHLDMENAFDLIGRNPRIARERTEINPPVRVQPCRSHLIIYVVEDDGVPLILRVRHGREDWIGDGED